jgi:hypothetical protein
MQLQFNWWAVLVSAALGMMVPAIWYAPKIFGSAWLQLSGITPEEDPRRNGAVYALAALSSLVTAFAIAGFLNFTHSESFGQGAMAGLQFWLGFVASQLVVDYRMANRPWKLTFINLGHSGITMTLMGGILAAWK